MMEIYTVGQITRYLKESLEANDFLADLWLSGELSNVSRSTAGHLYFTLKDPAGQMRCVMFRSALTGDVAAADGDAVVAHGRVSFYEARGDLQYIVDVLMPQGTGALHMEFQRLKAKLEAEGLFDVSRKRPIPEFPRRIAVVTSPTGAVLQDIITITRRRYPLVELLVVPVQVQGDAAADAIVAAFQTLNQRSDVDVVVLARGGGSLEELWPFNEEKTARAVYSSRAPVISAVGHETDYTIADYVADLRAPTPSVAAELAVPNRIELFARLAGAQGLLQSALEGLVGDCRDGVQQALTRLSHARPDIARERQHVDDLTRTALLHVRGALTSQRARLDQSRATLSALAPQRTLERGYAVVEKRATGEVVRKRASVKAGDPLSVQVSDGRCGATVEGKAPARGRKSKSVAPEQIALFGS